MFTHNFQIKLLCTFRFWSFALSGVQVSNIPIIGCCIFSSICLAEWPMTNREMAPQLGYKGASGNLNTMPLQGNPNPNNVIRIEYEVPLVGHDCDYKANTTRSSFLLSTTTICFGFLLVFCSSFTSTTWHQFLISDQKDNSSRIGQHIILQVEEEEVSTHLPLSPVMCVCLIRKKHRNSWISSFSCTEKYMSLKKILKSLVWFLYDVKDRHEAEGGLI